MERAEPALGRVEPALGRAKSALERAELLGLLFCDWGERCYNKDMQCVVAVSGGIDSMVLLDLLARVRADKLGAPASLNMRAQYQAPDASLLTTHDLDFLRSLPLDNLTVAHFNHGMRPSADADATFVRRAAERYGLPCVCQKVSLNPDDSEATARAARYDFLESVAHDGIIFTAHHLDDLVESVAINLLRGTGWRGLTPFWRQNSVQPFLQLERAWSRREIDLYAAARQIPWRQDPSNTESKYLRNRLRLHFQAIEAEQGKSPLKPPLYKTLMLDLYRQQCNNRREIEHALRTLVSGLTTHTQNGNYYPREFVQRLDAPLAQEVLRQILHDCKISATRPQIADFFLALKTYSPGKKFNLPHNRLALIRRHDFFVPKG